MWPRDLASRESLSPSATPLLFRVILRLLFSWPSMALNSFSSRTGQRRSYVIIRNACAPSCVALIRFPARALVPGGKGARVREPRRRPGEAGAALAGVPEDQSERGDPHARA